jgi:hypothetical protein
LLIILGGRSEMKKMGMKIIAAVEEDEEYVNDEDFSEYDASDNDDEDNYNDYDEDDNEGLGMEDDEYEEVHDDFDVE